MKKAYLLLLALFISVASYGIASITGVPTLCVGTTSTLANATPGGVWTSTNMAVATVGSATGVVTGVAAGNATITYMVGTAYAVMAISVFSTMPAMTWSGPTTFCAFSYGSTATNAFVGGTFSTSDTSIVWVQVFSNRGYIRGVSAGTAVITYSAVGCGYTTKSVTVTRNARITGPPTVCEHDSATYHNDYPGGYWWPDFFRDYTLDSITGVLSVLRKGDCYLNYTSPNGCRNSKVVYGTEAAIPITGPSSVCVSSTIGLNSGGGWGHTWTSSNPSVATVSDRSSSGPVTGVAAGTTVITYSTNAHCISTQTVTVTPATCTGAPAPGIASINSAGTCSGAADTVTLTGYTTCGTTLQWQSSPDSTTWTDVPGATHAPCRISPLESGYIRCKNTCLASGLSAYSNKLYTPKQSRIQGHSILVSGGYCPPTNFRLKICGVSNTLTLITRYGDGLADTMTPRYVAPDCDASLIHNYGMSGTYTLKHILLQGSTLLDSITYSYEHLNCFIMPIRFFFDRDSNCTYDTYDWMNYTPIETEVDSNGIPIDTVSISGGTYYRDGPYGTVFTFRPLLDRTGLKVFCPSSGIIKDTVNYGVLPAVKYFSIICDTLSGMDLAIRPIFNVGRHLFQGRIFPFNNYLAPQNATVTMSISPKYRLESSSPPAIVSGNNLIWNFTGLAGSTPSSYIYFKCINRDTWLTIGDTVQTRISITPTVGDVDVSNNFFIRVDTIKASWDPNMIEVSPTGLVLPCDELLYTVHFENTGNDTAYNIHVMDTLSDNVELRGMQIVSAPEGMQLAYSTAGGHNVVKFDFPNIKLLDSSHPGQNMAQFSFKVKVKNGLPDGTVIPNRVGIYFDANEVVMTNQVENTIGIAPILGPDSICGTGQIVLTCATAGGIWTASNALATVAGGTVTGVARGIDTIIYTVTNACVSRSSTKAITMSDGLMMTVGITKSPGSDSICAGAAVTFSAQTSGAVVLPDFLWKINGTPADTTQVMTYRPVNRDIVSVTIKDSLYCSAFVADTVTVHPIVVPAVSIAGLPGGILCQGTAITLTANATNGGTEAGYLWQVNGLAAATGAAYTYTPQNTDLVAVTLTSSIPCASPRASTAQTTIAVTPAITPVVTIATNDDLSVYSEETVVCRAIATDTGMAPQYQWLLNGTDITGATTATYVTATLADGDAVSCRVTPSGDCASAPTTATVVFSVTTVDRGGLSITPNPTKGTFTIKGSAGNNIIFKSSDVAWITVKNVVGQEVYSSFTPIVSATINATIQLPANLPKGNYILILRAADRNRILRFVLD